MILQSVLLILTVLLLIIFYLLWYQNFSHFFCLLKKIPGPPSFPIIGNLLLFLAPPDQLFKIQRELARKYYPLYKEWALRHGAVNLLNPDDIELVLSNSKHNDKSDIYNFLHFWLGTGLLTSGGTKWQIRRKILTPAFHFNILQQFVPIFNEETQKLVEKLKNKGPQIIDVIPPITQFTLLSIAETSMGVKLDASPQNCQDYKSAIHTFGYALTYRLSRPWLYNPNIFYNLTKLGKITKQSIKILHDFSRNVIKQKTRNFEAKEGKRMAMLDLLLTAKNRGAEIDDEGIAEEVDTFMFEGHDTTSISISYTLLLLANHSKIQNEIYSEMTSVLDLSKPPSYNELKELSFMERCIKESLRLFPSVPFISRLVSEDFKTASGYTVPKNAMAHIHIYDLHHNPDIYPDPEKFDPDRFLPENTKSRHPFAYLPFSAGPRNCIGQKFAMLELKALLCGILSNFVLEPVDKPENVEMITDLVLRSKGSIRVKFVPRKNL